MAEPADDRFDVGARFVQISGRGGNKPYLPVQARVDWFRHDYPEGIIEQDIVFHDDKQAIFKSTVTKIRDGAILGRADGYGQEYAKAFEDYLLKAATVSIGRALNALGYGGSDLDEGVAEGNIADAPVERPVARGAAPTPIETRRPANTGTPATAKQINYIRALGKERGFTRFDDGDGLLHADDETIRRAINKEFKLYVEALAEISNADARKVLDTWAPPKDQPQGQPTQQPSATFKRIPPGQTTDVPDPDRDLSGEPGDPLAFTTVWNELRAAGVKAGDIAGATDLIGFWDVNRPAEMLAALRAKVALMPPVSGGSAGNDKWSR